MDWRIILIIIAVLVFADKLLTYFSVKQVEKNFPEVHAIEIEKNPVAKFFFTKFGLGIGSLIFGIVTWIGTCATFYFLSRALSQIPYTAGNPLGITLYIIFLIYGFVITNNIYFLLRYSKII